MAAPDERAFTTFARGGARNIILEAWRNSLRTMDNPETGQPFTEDEIQRATQPGSRYYIEADAIDLAMMAYQQRGLYLSDQIDPRRANSVMLDEEHGYLWLGPNSRLNAVGASGQATAKGSAGSTYVGSTTLGDPSAAVATDPNGTRYQVLVTASIAPGDTQVTLAMQAVLPEGDTDGEKTNLDVNTVLKWSFNTPPGSDPTAAVADQGNGVGFRGGFNRENDQEYALRIEDRIRKRPASGNWAHFEAWAEQASIATEQAFVYPCAFSAGSVMVVPVQKRNKSADPPQGPSGRVPSAALLVALNSFLVPPNSPVVPGRAYVYVTAPQFVGVNQIERIAMSRGSAGGWADVIPWPNPPTPVDLSTTERVRIASLTDQLNFTVTTTSLLPGQSPSVPIVLSGALAPKIMAWDVDTSRFEPLVVGSISHDGVSTATVVLLAAPTMTLVDDADPGGGTRISPYTDQHEVIAESFEEYFDSLGAGEIYPETDTRYARAARQPRPQDEYPMRAGQALVGVLLNNLGSAAADAQLTWVSQATPAQPNNVSDGPELLVMGHVNLYPLE